MKTALVTIAAPASTSCATAWAAKPPEKWPADSEWIRCWSISVLPRSHQLLFPVLPLRACLLRAGTLGGVVQLANQTIRRNATQNINCQGMGSTIVAVLVEGEAYSVAHVGDSRVYLLRKGNIQQLTEDHSLVMEQVRRGLITEEQARHSELQNVIVRALGTADAVEPDLSDLVAEPGDTLLLTSDGLTRHLTDAEILAIAGPPSSLHDACQRLIAAAKAAGGQDNITCVLLRFVRQSWMRKVLGGSSNHDCSGSS